MSFFSLDSKFSQIMGRVFDLMMLNIIFLIMCIPIVTIGANFTAMYADHRLGRHDAHRSGRAGCHA